MEAMATNPTLENVEGYEKERKRINIWFENK